MTKMMFGSFRSVRKLSKVSALVSLFLGIYSICAVQADSHSSTVTAKVTGEGTLDALVTHSEEENASFRDHSQQALLLDDLLNFGKNDIVCQEVAESIVRLSKPGRRLTGVDERAQDDEYEHRIDFTCIVHQEYDSTSTRKTRAVHYDLLNVGPSFSQERMDAMAQGKTSLIVRNGIIEGSTLTVPDQAMDEAPDGMESYTSVLEWQEPPGGPNSHNQRYSRRLASNQFGLKTVLIFRVSVDDGNGQTSTPTKTAQEISDSIFGDWTDAVNLRTQYKACSYDKIEFVPATDDDLTPLISDFVEGVVDIEVNVDYPFLTSEIEQEVQVKAENATEDGGLGLDLELYDHVMMMIPPGSYSKGSPLWVAYAYKPGVISVYNDERITSSLVQLHEIGHNLGLHHSGEVNPNGSEEEYGDHTCVMGTGPYVDDTHRCFNSAKMIDLGWYENTFSFNPATEDFEGKVIGVADYGNASDNHHVAVEILNPIPTEENLYLTLNTQKGINLDTGEKADMVTIVRAKSGLPSMLFAALEDADSARSVHVSDFFNGRDLVIEVVSMGVDVTVNYALVKAYLQVETCNVDADCSTGANGCTAAICNTSNNKCEYSVVVNCCGNGICEPEFGEHCGTCSDCRKPDHCNDLGYFDLPKKCTKVIRTSGSWSPAGHMFDIDAVTDLTIYAFEIMYAGQEILGEALDVVTPEVYVKKGTWVGSQFDQEAWDTVYSGKTIPVVIPNVTCPGPLTDDVVLDRGIKMKAGETYGIYITLKEPAQLWMRPATNFEEGKWESVGDVLIENNEMKIKAGVSPEYPFGLYIDFMGYPTYFIGRPKYYYGAQCYSDDQCDDGNSLTIDTCNLSTNECENAVGANINICGNGICEPASGESCFSCKEDCRIPFECDMLGLGMNEFGKGWINGTYRYDFDNDVNGNMFEIEALEDITIYAIEIYTFRDEYQEDETAQIWTKKGSFEGFEELEEVWTTVLDATVATFAKEKIVLNLDHAVRLKANEKQTFYVAIEDGWTLNYKEGTGVGNVVIENDKLRILEGVALGKAWFTRVTKIPVMFYGSIKYEFGHECYSDPDCDDGDIATVDSCLQTNGENDPGSCSNTILPNVCGNRICESASPTLETWFGCPKDCETPGVDMNSSIGRWKYDEEVNSYNTPKGMMFDLEAISDVTVHGIDLGVYYPDSYGEVEIYVTRSINGTFEGNEQDASKWIRVHFSQVTWKYNTPGVKIRLQSPFRIEANSKRGVYVTFTSSSYHSLVTLASFGTGVGNVVSENDDLKLLEGSMNSYPFGINPITPKIFMGRIRYFKSMACRSSAECDDLNDGTIDSCDQGECRNTIIPNVCGNGVCEVSVGEYCSTCSLDCDDAPNICNELSWVDTSGSYSTSGSDKGILFSVEALKDMTFYEIRAAVASWVSIGYVSLYTKLGPFDGNTDMNTWDLVFSGNVEKVCPSGSYCSGPLVKFPLSRSPPVATPAGSFRTFYLDLSASPLRYGGSGVVYSNDDLNVYSGSTIGEDLNTIRSNDMKFSGLFKYDLDLIPWTCETSADCDDGNDGTDDSCVDGVCRNTPIPGVCGNGICETWIDESCSTCPLDCGPPLYCNELMQDAGPTGTFSSSIVRGIAFDIQAIKSVAVSEINLEMGYQLNSCGAKVYTKTGSYNKDGSSSNRALNEQSLDAWTKIFDEENVQVIGNKLKLTFSNTKLTVIEAESIRAFYVTLSEASRLIVYGDQEEGAVVDANSDVIVYAGEIFDQIFGVPSYSTNVKIRGSVTYDINDVEAPTSAPSSFPTSSDPVAKVGGDPHFQTFNGQYFSFHGQCDLVMMKSKNFASGLGLAMHIRTTRVEKADTSYSYISGTALKIGDDTIEVMDNGSMLLNGKPLLVEDHAIKNTGYLISRRVKGAKKRIIVYNIYFSHDNSIEIRINMKTGMLFVDISGTFHEDSVGLLGSPALASTLLSRDRKIDLTGQWNTLGEDWQVQGDDPKLFQDRNRHPQHPFGCMYEIDKSRKRNIRRRRLLALHEDVTTIDHKAAREACQGASEQKKQFCIDDLIATGDMTLSEDPFYH